MKRITGFFSFVLILAIVGCIAAYWWSSHYIVRTEPGVIILQKRYLSLDETYFDVRDWNSDMFDSHAELKEAMEQQGYGDVIEAVRREELKAAVEEKAEALKTEAEALREAIRRKLDDWLAAPDGREQESAPPGQSEADAEASQEAQETSE